MNAQQRKKLRDGHLMRLGGIGATVLIAKRYKALLRGIDGADNARVEFMPLHSIVGNPVQHEYKAAKLEPHVIARC